ncbi:MAG: hypothetical protein CMK64_03415 [Pseudoalteromonas sp.]|nr:hypothetical protein [Pseudoalteromonas sp.]
MHNHFEGLKLTLAVLKISYLEQLNHKIFVLLSTSFLCLKIAYFIKRIGLICRLRQAYKFWGRDF